MNENKSYINLDTINWFSFNKEGFIVSNNGSLLPNVLERKAGVYIYQLLSDINKVYIGSSYNIEKRITQHRYSINSDNKYCPKFCNCTRVHSWNNLKLEYYNI